MRLHYLLVFIVLALFTSCEDVIILDLDSSQQRDVIEANLNAGTGECLVKLSRTGDFYQTNDFEAIENAQVQLKMGNGTIYTLTEDVPGNYKWDSVQVQPGDSATMSITLEDGTFYEAKTVCPSPAPIDSLELEVAENPFTGDTLYQLFYNFQDAANVNSYYRLKVSVNDTLLDGYIIYDDDGQDGEAIRIPFFGPPFEPGDSLAVQLLSTDKAYFDYFTEIGDVASQGTNAAVPYNPSANFGEEVLGFFSIWYSSRSSIVAPD